MKTIEDQFLRKLALLIIFFAILCAGAFAQFEPALNFDGSAISTYDYIEVPDANSLDITNAFTFEAWVRFDNVTDGVGGADDFQGVFYKSTFNGNYGLAYSRSGILRFYHIGFGASITDYSWAPVVDTWYHVAVTFNGTKSAIVVDGTEVASQTAVASSLTPNTEPLVIGASPFTGASTWPFEGSMEEIRMWNIAKTASEINTSKDTELKGDESGLVLYYHFNEGTIGGDNTSISFVRDRSLQGNNGTLNGFALTGSTGNFVSSTDLSLATPFTDQTITFGTLANRTFGDADFSLSATGGSSGNPVTFSSSDETVVTVSGSTVTVLNAGTSFITAFQDGLGTTRHAEAAQSLTVDPFATNIELNLPAANPKFSGMPQGISPTANDIDGNPTLAILTEYSPTGAGTFSTIAPTNPGVYDVRANLDTEPNYSASEVTGILTIESFVGLDIADTLKVQVEAGKTLVSNLNIVNSESTSLTWSLALSDTLGYGYETAFAKANFASWQLPENQDRITDNVYITRGDNKSIFNARTETTSTNSISPADTEWSRSNANAATLFDPFVTMHGGNPGSLVGDTATVHLITDDQYHEVVFSTFSGGNSGGGFSYTRTPMHDYVTISGVASGSISAQSFAGSQITFDATSLKPGLNYGMMTLTTNDPTNPTMTVVTEVEVLPEAVFTLSETIVGDTVAIADPAATKTFKIQNTGASELTWSTTTSGRPNFMNLVTFDAFSGTVPAGGEAIITVTFDAAVFGYYEWPVTFTTNDPGNPNPTMTISMLASGVPFAVVSAPGVMLDDTFVGYQSSQELTFNNTGTDTLFVYNAAVDQPGVTLTVDSLTILPNSGLQSLELVFEPTVAGVVSGNLTFDTNDPTKLSNTLPFMGTALDLPVIEVNPLSITQSLTVNDTVTTQVTISNTGGSDLTWTVAASLPDAPRIAFSDPVNVSSGGGPLGTDDLISPKVTLSRSFFGFIDLYNKLEVSGNPPTNLQSTTIRWSSKPTLESVDADYVNSLATVRTTLGGNFVGSTISLHLIEENRYFDLEIITYPVGAFQNAFTYNRREILQGVAPSISQGSTTAGGDTQFDMEFYGGRLTTGTFDGSYTITSNDPLTPSLVLPISLTVTGGEANLATTSATATALGTQVNQTSEFSLEIINTGTAPLNVSDVTVDDPAFGIGTTSFSVPVNGTYNLPLSFAPTLVQTYNATLSVISDDPANSPFDVALTGVGLDIPEFQLASVLIQDTLAVGVTNAKMIRVINNAAGDLNWNIAEEIAFEKEDYADPNTEAAQDRISNFVWLTRGDKRPTYNHLEAPNYVQDHTSILYGDGTTFSMPTYGTFIGTFQFGADGQVGNTTSLYLVEEDRYFDLAYTKWTSLNSGGGFAYTRREAVPWLELGSLSGAVAGVGQEDVTATFKTDGLASGDYEFTYDIATNDPVNPLQTVTFQLHVIGIPDINVTFASDSVRFGNVIIGQTTTLPVTINNVGDSTLTVSDIAFDNMAFGIDQTNFKVEPGKNVVLNVSFTPTMVATYKAGFTITSDDPDESPIEFGVRGTGIDGPNLDLDVTILNLQAVAGGVASADLTLSNSGQQLVEWNLSSKYINGSETTFTKASFADWNLAQNQDRISNNVWISRKDSDPLLNIFTNNNNFISWAENKTVLSGALPTYEPDISDAFGGGSSMSSISGNTMSLQLAEEGRFFDVHFNSWASGGGSGSGGGGAFSYTRNELATWLSLSALDGSIVAAGSDQVLTISADAANLSAGTYSANLVLASTGVEPEQTVVVNLTVLGAPQIAVTQNSLDFGGVIENTEETLELEIANNGNSTLNISDLTIDNPTFSVSNSPLVIEPGTTELIPITFSPSLVQSYTGTLTITNDDATNSSVTVTLSGAGISPPTASVDVAELRESLFFGASSTQTFNIENTGSTDLIWSLAADATATTFVNPNSDAVAFSIENGALPSGSSQAVIVTFNPSGIFTGTFELPLQVVSNDPNNGRIDIPLSLTVGGITINSTIADQLEQPGFVSSQFDITGMFTDAQSDPLTISVSSSDETIATVSELSDMVTVTEVGNTGTAMISITADDGKGTSETFSFDFRVNAAPTVVSAIGNQAYGNGFGSATFDLSAVFTDLDLSDVLTYSSMTDAMGIVGVSIANGILTVTEQTPGTVNVTVSASDGFGGLVSDVFEVSVDKTSQTITFNALADVTYGGASFDLSATSSSGLTVTYASSDVSVATVAGSTVTIVGAGTTTITASQAGDATYNAATDVQQSLTVNQASLTATADDQSKTYGDTNPSLTISYTGFLNGDDASVLDTAPSAGTTADATSNAGTYAITSSGGVDNNYAITHVDGTLTINQASLSATADDHSKTYGEANPTLTVTYSGFVNGDDANVLDTAPSAITTADATSNAGTYTITSSGGADNNYAITHVDGTLTVGQAALTATADDQSKTYGDANPSLTITYAGFVNGDDISVLDTAPIAATTANATSNAGTYAITSSGGADNNYAITHVDGTLTIGQAALTATADDQSKTYGDANPSLTFTYSGFVNGDDASVLDTAPITSTAADATSNTGTYAITSSGGVDMNYAITHVDGTLTIGQASLTATSDDQNKAYGDANPTLTITYSGFANGEDASVLDTVPTATTTADATSNAGMYTITSSGGVDTNYAITHVDGALTIGQASLTATVDDQNKTYGDANPTLTTTYTGFVNGEDANVLDTAPTVATAADATSNAGTYAITASGGVDTNYVITHVDGTLTIGQATLTVTPDDASRVYGSANPTFIIGYTGFVNGDDANVLDTPPTASTAAITTSDAGTYPITSIGGSDVNYAMVHVDGTLTIGQAALTATADDLNKTYGDANPTLTITYSGFVNGEDANVLDNAPTVATAVDATSNAGTYAITALGGVDNNYAITHMDGTLTIDQATLTARADDQMISEGDALPAFTISYAGFVNGDDETSFDTTPTATSNVTSSTFPGTYDIVPAGGVALNYTFNYVNGLLTINEVLSVTVVEDVKVYPNPFTDFIQVKTSSGKTLEVIDQQGRTLLNRTANEVIDVSGLNAGLYFIQIKNADGVVIHRTRVIKRGN